MDSGGRIALPAYLRLLRGNANFRKLWLAQMVSEMGDWMYIVAIYNRLLEATGGSAKSIGFAFVLQVLPQMLVSPLAGVLNDRLSRRAVMIFSDWARAAIVAAMLFAQHSPMIWLIYVLLFLETVFWALFEPARSAAIPNVVDEKDVVVANSMASITWSFNFAVGFSIGGFIAAMAGREAVFVINVFSFVLSAVLIARMRFPEPHLEQLPALRARDLANFTPIVEGVQYVSRDRRLLATLLVKFGLGFMGANWVLVTILGERKFPVHLPGVDPASAGMLGMSILMGSRGLGALIGPLVGTWLAGRDETRMRYGILLGFLAASAGYLLLGQADSALIAAAVLILGHSGGSVIWVFSTTLLQTNSLDRFRGRVFSAEFAFMTLSMSVSSASAGALIDAGVRVETVVSSVGAVMLVPGAGWLLAQRLWNRQPAPPESP
jgi:MFS family permease